MSQPKKKPRRQYIVNPSFQWHYLRMILGIEAMIFFVTVMLTLGFYQLILGPAMFASGHFWAMLGSYVVLFIASSVFLLHLSLQTSNRISGPIFRISQILKEIASGHIPEPIRFREGDFHPELALHMNQALAALRNRQDITPEDLQRQIEHLQRLSDETLPEITRALGDLSRLTGPSTAPERRTTQTPE